MLEPLLMNPTEIDYGYDLTYVETLSSTDFATATQMASIAGLTAGTVLNNTSSWMKFNYNGQILIVAQKGIRASVSWNNLNAAGLVFGKTVTVKGQNYKIRLMTGGNGDPSSAAGGEWDRLMYAVGSSRPSTYSGPVLQSFSNTTLGVAVSNGNVNYSTLCQEKISGNTGNCVRRGRDALNWYAGLAITDNGTAVTWRPILELLDQ